MSMSDSLPPSKPTPPCSFCGTTEAPVSIGFRAMICDRCIRDLGTSLQSIERGKQRTVDDQCVAGAECVFCERILSTAKFSLHRWVFGICDVCACSVAAFPIRYAGSSPQGFAF
jgi:hypothetical protein